MSKFLKPGCVVMTKANLDGWWGGDLFVVTRIYQDFYGQLVYCKNGDDSQYVFMPHELTVLHTPIEPGDVVMVTEAYFPGEVPPIGAVVVVGERCKSFVRPAWYCNDGFWDRYIFFENELEIIG